MRRCSCSSGTWRAANALTSGSAPFCASAWYTRRSSWWSRTMAWGAGWARAPRGRSPRASQMRARALLGAPPPGLGARGVERAAAQLGEVVVDPLVLGAHAGGRRHLLLLRQRHHLLVGLAVVADHLLAEALHRRGAAVALGELAHLDLRHPAARGRGHERGVAGGQSGVHLRPRSGDGGVGRPLRLRAAGQRKKSE